MSEKEWSSEQKQCINSHGGTLLVSAAAGSGKTSVLIERIVTRITSEDHPVDIDRLLVVTFTRAAAAEMKSRLAKKLSDCLQEQPDNLRLQRQQLLLPQATISTVDSFCSDLIRENFHLLNISPQFRIAEEQQLTLLQNEAMLETLTNMYAKNDPDFNELASMLSNGKSDTALMSAIERIYKFLQSYPDPDRWLDNMGAIYDDTAAVKDTVWGHCILDHIAETLNQAFSLCQTALSLCDNDGELTQKYRPALENDLAYIRQLQATCQSGCWDTLFVCLAGHKFPSLGSVKECNVAVQERIQQLRDKMKDLLKKQADLLCGNEADCRSDLCSTHRLMNALYAAVRQFSTQYAAKKAHANLLDFSDVEHFALQLLTQTAPDGSHVPTDLANELSQRYEEILVDEYQDTNAVQDALFSALSRHESNLFLVGDVKQSIYGFRQAMPELFLQRRADYPLFDEQHYPGTVMLGKNYRSRREVTDAVNFVFRQLLSEKSGGLTYDDREALVYSADYPPSCGHEPEFLVIDKPSWDDRDNDFIEAEAIANRIQELVGVLPVGKDRHPLCYGECCILIRSRSSAFREVLEQHGIPVVTDTASSFLDTAEIRLALSLLRCIDNPLQDVPLAAWLLSPLCGFTPDDMAVLRRCRPHASLYTALTAACTLADNSALASRCREAVAFLERYRTLACQLTVDRLVTRLYEDTALPELMSARADGKRRQRNLQQLQELCSRFEQNGFRGLPAFIRYIDRVQAQNADFPVSDPPDGDNAVRILTIHSSKGLEFPVVFLAGLGKRFNTNDLRSNLLLHPKYGAGIKRRDEQCNQYVTLPHRAIALMLDDEYHAEELRVLYVAMTRAKEKLCFSMVTHAPENKLTTLAATLDDKPALPAHAIHHAQSMGEWLLTALLRHPDAAAWRHAIDREDLPVLADELHWQLKIESPLPPCVSPTITAEEPAPDPATEDLLRERIAYRYPHRALAHIPSKLAASDTAHGTVNRQFVATSRPAFQCDDGITPTERGTAMHTFMQFAEYESASRDLNSEIQRLLQSGFLTKQQAASLNRQKLSAFFAGSLYRRMCCSPCCRREFPFTALRSAASVDPTADPTEQLVIQGIADCVFEEEDGLVIVDYKTDRVRSAAELCGRYREQIAIYRQALSEILERPVKECLLYSFELNDTVVVEDSP